MRGRCVPRWNGFMWMRRSPILFDEGGGDHEKLKQGIGLDPNQDMGPLTTEAQLKIVEDQMKEVRERGATVLAGGDRNHELPGFFTSPR